MRTRRIPNMDTFYVPSDYDTYSQNPIRFLLNIFVIDFLRKQLTGVEILDSFRKKALSQMFERVLNTANINCNPS